MRGPEVLVTFSEEIGGSCTAGGIREAEDVDGASPAAGVGLFSRLFDEEEPPSSEKNLLIRLLGKQKTILFVEGVRMREVEVSAETRNS